jgi:hypothetical protein
MYEKMQESSPLRKNLFGVLGGEDAKAFIDSKQKIH